MSLRVLVVASETRVVRSNDCGRLAAAAANTSASGVGAPANSAATPV
jgi:hypothetical protein